MSANLSVGNHSVAANFLQFISIVSFKAIRFRCDNERPKLKLISNTFLFP